MNKYKRTNFYEKWSTDKGNKPLVWTYDKEKGYKTVRDCLLAWYLKKSLVPTNDFWVALNYMARNESAELVKDPTDFYEVEDWQYNGTDADKYINEHVLDFKSYQRFEDKYHCSGLCHTGLFYFG